MHKLIDITVFDIEADNLLDGVTKIHCIVTSNKDGIKKWHNSPMLERDGSLEDGISYLQTQPVVSGHNIIGYDLPVLRKLHNVTLNVYLDTFILSQMLFANERQTHGLDEWGKMFGIPKPKQEQWQVFNGDMLHRCVEDTKINQRLLQKCMLELEKDNWNWDRSIQLEQDVYKVYTEMGTEIKLDVQLLFSKLYDYEQIYNKINCQLAALKKPDVIIGKETKAYTAKGELSVAAINHKAVGDFCKVSFKEFQPSSVKQLVEFLLSVGWKPEKFTPKEAPSLRDDPLIGVPLHIKAVVSDYRDAIHRKGVLEGFVKRVRDDGTIKMFSYTCGTNTARFRHSIIANIQPEFKDLFIAKDGYKYIGCDASQLEARVEGHFTSRYDGGTYAKYLLEMDVHQFNADAWGVTRAEAKAPFYAMCVPESTQILTKNGWKHHSELVLGELVLTYNSSSNTKEWKPLQEKVIMVGEVFEFGNSHKKFQATDDHTWFVKRYRHTKAHGRVDPKVYRKVSADLNSEDMIVMNAPFTADQDLVNFDYDIKNNLKYSTNWSKIVLQMSHQQRKAWLNAFLLAEGTNKYREGKCNEWSWVQNKGEIAEAAILCSYLVNDGQIHITNKQGTNKEMYNVMLGYKQHITCQNFTKKSLGLQTVWCPKTENGSWVMRQGNMITITGNCYGAGTKKMALMLNVSESRAKEIIDMHYETWYGLKQLTDEIETCLGQRGFLKLGKWGKKDLDESKNPWIKSIDGRKLFVRGMHKLKNTLIQSAGSIAMKWAYVRLYDYIKQYNLDAKIIMFYHDEFVVEVKDDEKQIKLLTELTERAIVESGEYFKLRIPLKGEAKVGNNWKEVK